MAPAEFSRPAFLPAELRALRVGAAVLLVAWLVVGLLSLAAATDLAFVPGARTWQPDGQRMSDTVRLLLATGGLAMLLAGPILLHALRTLERTGRRTLDAMEALHRSESELRSRADALALAHEHLSLVTRAGNVGAWTWDFDDGSFDASESLRSQLGLSAGAAPDSGEALLARVHPDDQPRVRSEIDSARADRLHGVDSEFRLRHADGSWRIFRVRGEWLRHDAGAEGGRPRRLMAVLVDVSDLRRIEAQVETQRDLANRDPLTGLANRRAFEARLRRVLEGAPDSTVPHAVLSLDLDEFKPINDACGHAAGDRVLRDVSSLLDRQLRDRDTLARLGGDEFVVLLERTSETEANAVAEKLRQAVHDYRHVCDGRVWTLGVSIGIAMASPPWPRADLLMNRADQACYQAKRTGRDRVVPWRPHDRRIAPDERDLVEQLRGAIAEDRIDAVWQRILPIGGDAVARAAHDSDEQRIEYREVYARLRRIDGDALAAAAFVPVAERHGLMPAIDRRVIDRVLERLAAMPDTLRRIGHCGINLSGTTLGSPGLAAHVLAALVRTGVPGDRLCLEFTERAATTHLPATLELIDQLRPAGCRFALDTFGAGVASISTLRRLPVDFVKIDGTLATAVGMGGPEAEMVLAITRIAHSMGQRTIAAFVDGRVLLERLAALGVDFVQGDGIGGTAQPIGPLA